MSRLLQACAAASLAASWAAALTAPNMLLQTLGVTDCAGRLGAAAAESTRPSFNLSVPIDHFHNESRYEPHSDDSFNLRYWFDDSYYKEGGPVIVLSAGETSGENRLPFLDHGIASILAEATGGMAVILEHRFYGTSFPTPDTSVESLRLLSTEQALADTAYFAQHVKFAGHEHQDLTAPETAWIIYGGSYAGVFSALARKIYPDAFWGGISSSGVPTAIADYWEYLEAARLYAPGECAPVTQKLTNVIDIILFGDDEAKVKELKDAFGLGGLSNPEFGWVITRGIEGLQSTNWDPEIDEYDFGHYCGAITSDSLLYRSTAHLAPSVKGLVTVAGYEAESQTLVAHMLNYIGYVRSYVQTDRSSAGCKGRSAAECYAQQAEHLKRTDLDAGWQRAWLWQSCTQWGYFINGGSVPDDQLPLVSRAVDVEFASTNCRTILNVTDPPDVESINKYGSFNFSFPRVAFLDGAQDPWRAAGMHRLGLEERESTTSEPFILVDYGVHHWDENSVENITAGHPDFPPAHILKAQQQQIDFVKAWMEDFAEHKRSKKEQDGPGEL